MTAKLQIISLGQGQGGPAKMMIEEGRVAGNWVLMQNCHLARTFMRYSFFISDHHFSFYFFHSLLELSLKRLTFI
jgi:hypothetical protein